MALPGKNFLMAIYQHKVNDNPELGDNKNKMIM